MINTRKKRSKSAEAGIGTLVLFIAFILVAAAAAAVFIQTSQSLQGKALNTGANAQKGITTDVLILSAWGENASANNNIGDVYLKIKLAPGSDAILLNNSYVSVATSAARQTYRFNQTSGCNPTNLSLNSDVSRYPRFMITPKIGYTKVGYLQEGDLADICFRLPTNLTGDAALTVSFTPQGGTVSSFSTTVPSVITDSKTQLFP